MDKRTAAAIAKYTVEGCKRAHYLNDVVGEGPRSIALSYDIPNVTTVAAANAAINAGHAIKRIEAITMSPALISIKNVNAALKKLGFAEKLTRGRGYFYFRDGDAYTWSASAVYVSDITAYTVDGWIAERNHLASRSTY